MVLTTFRGLHFCKFLSNVLVPLNISTAPSFCDPCMHHGVDPSSPQVVDIEDIDVAAVIEVAQAIWARFYGRPRVSGSENRVRRCDTGVPRVVQSNPSSKPSLTSWLKQRRHAVSEGQGHIDLPANLDENPIWTDGHEKEIKFLKE